MKKLIAISVVFALVAGVAFAVDLGGTVIGTVQVIKADSDSGDVNAGGGFNRARIDGGGEVADGKFGGYIRLDGNPAGLAVGVDSAYAWWKPIDQLKLIIGNFSDGFWGQDGNSRWAFYQQAGDTGVAMEGSNAWGWGLIEIGGFNLSNAFFGGYGAGGVFLEITPVDMVAINIGLPFFCAAPWESQNIQDVFKQTNAQIALNMSFGTIAFTYKGNTDIKKSQVFGYFGLTAIDNLRIDFGLGSNFDNLTDNTGSNATDDPNDDRLSIGLAVKYATDSWGIKFRSMFAIPVSGTQTFGMLFDVLPYFVINDSFRVFVSGGVGISSIDSLEGGASWHVNPYIEVGEEWGPKFFAGIKVYQCGSLKGATSAPVKFELPIALLVSF